MRMKELQDGSILLIHDYQINSLNNLGALILALDPRNVIARKSYSISGANLIGLSLEILSDGAHLIDAEIYDSNANTGDQIIIKQ